MRRSGIPDATCGVGRGESASRAVFAGSSVILAAYPKEAAS
jgi:hypothetical protein